MPGLGAGQQVADGALRQPQHTLAKQALADGVLAQRLLHLLHKLLRVDVGVAVKLLLGDRGQHGAQGLVAGHPQMGARGQGVGDVLHALQRGEGLG